MTANPLNIPLSATSMNDKQDFRVKKINGIGDYFVAEIKDRELMSKKPSKYIVLFFCFTISLGH